MAERYIFRGYPEFLDRAAGEAGSTRLGRPPEALLALGHLCGQATTAEPADAAAILGRAAEFRDRLRIAARAGELMLAEVARGLGVDGYDIAPATGPSSEAPAPVSARPSRPGTGRPGPNRPGTP